MPTQPIPDYVHDHFRAHPGHCRPQIKLADGHAISVQASSSHYCTPKGEAERYPALYDELKRQIAAASEPASGYGERNPW